MSQQINLVNPLLLRKRYAFGLREMGIGVAATLALALSWAGYLGYRASVLETEATQKEALQAAAQQELDALTAAANRPASALLTERVKTLQAQAAQREAVLASLDDTLRASSAGFAAQMRGLALGRTEGVWLNRFTLAHGYIALEGSARDVALLPAYMNALGRQPAFAGLQFAGMKAGATSDATTASATDTPIDFSLYSGKRSAPGAGGESHEP